VHYLRLAIWPDRLCLDYGWPVARSVGEIAPYLVVLSALIAAIVAAGRKHLPASFLGAWFFIILIPTSSFIPIADAAVEHRMYLSLAALAALLVCGSFALISRNSTGQGISKAFVCGGVLLVVVLSALTIRRNGDYSSKLAIWQDTVDKSPNNPRAQYDLGVSLEETGDMQGALLHYQLAVDKSPRYADALTNLAHLLLTAGKPEQAVAYLRTALEVNPKQAATYNILGLAFAQQGHMDDAVSQWMRALQLKPDFAEAHNNLGIIRAQQSRNQEAMHEWQLALQYDPGLADARNNFAYLLFQEGKMRESIEQYEKALAVRPGNYTTQINLARLLATVRADQGGNAARAASLAERACGLPGRRDAACLDTLTIAYAAANRFDDAARTAQAAMDLANSAGNAPLAKEFERRLSEYRRRPANPASPTLPR